MIHNKLNYIGIDIGGSHFRIAVESRGETEVLTKYKWPEGLSAQQELFLVFETVEKLVGSLRQYSIRAIGVSLAANVDGQGVAIKWPNRQHWEGINVRAILKSLFRIPVYIEEDGNCAAIAESCTGPRYKYLINVGIGTGIGAGIILDGELYRGKTGLAGEIGHINIDPNGALCVCGRRGCLQTFISARAIHSSGSLEEKPYISPIVRSEFMEQSAATLGHSLAMIVSLLDLEAVAISGGLVFTLGSNWWDILETTFYKHLYIKSRNDVAIYCSNLKDDACLIGAITLAKGASKKIYEQ